MLDPGDVPTAIAASPDGGVWFTIDSANAIGRVRNGKLERFVEEKTNGEPIGIAATADGSAWYTDGPAGQITRISPSGELHSVPLDGPIARIGQLAIAPDGALWFTEASAYSITRLKDGTFERHVIDRIRGAAIGHRRGWRRHGVGHAAGCQPAAAHRPRRQHADLRHPHARQLARRRGRGQGWSSLVPGVSRQQGRALRRRAFRGVPDRRRSRPA